MSAGTVDFRLRLVVISAAFAALSGSGCEFNPPDPPLRFPVVPVEGRLTIDGRPMPAGATGWVTFHPIDGTVGDPVVARLAGDGTFRCNRTPVGPLQVRIDFPPAVIRDFPPVVQRLLAANRGPASSLRYTSAASNPPRCDFDLARLPPPH